MYIPPAFQETDLSFLHAIMRTARRANLVTSTAEGLIATPLPLFLENHDGEMGTLYGHLVKANPQSKHTPGAEALAIFMGPDAYVTPSWYEGKSRDGKVVPTWNYVAVHAHGHIEFFEDVDRLLDVVTRLTDFHEAQRPQQWSVGDAPTDFIRAQLQGIVGVRLPITRIDAARKMSQNRQPQDRTNIAEGLSQSPDARDRSAAALIPR